MSEGWLIYAPGGGFGHCVRALSLARAALKEGLTDHILIMANRSAVSLGLSFSLDPRIQLIELDDRLSLDPFREHVRRRFDRYLSPEFSISQVIIDTFPRGIVGELYGLFDSISVGLTLVHRITAKEYIQRGDVQEALAKYDQIIAAGESSLSTGELQIARTGPWLLFEANELHSREDARKILRSFEPRRPLCLVVLAGKPAEQQSFIELALRIRCTFSSKLDVRVCGSFNARPPAELIDHFIGGSPVLKLLPGVDILIGSGGYNTHHEARATRTPLLAIPQPRLYDRQSQRLDESSRFENEDDLVGALEHRLSGHRFSDYGDSHYVQPEFAPFENGVIKAAHFIAAI